MFESTERKSKPCTELGIILLFLKPLLHLGVSFWCFHIKFYSSSVFYVCVLCYVLHSFKHELFFSQTSQFDQVSPGFAKSFILCNKQRITCRHVWSSLTNHIQISQLKARNKPVCLTHALTRCIYPGLVKAVTSKLKYFHILHFLILL